MKIQIKSIFGSLLFEGDFSSLADALTAAIKAKADLSYANLRYANLSSADLSYADLSYANLSYANLSSADLSSANLRYANLRYANLRYANLSSADLSSADLSYANLSSADLSYADLSYANLSYANLSSADLSSANLSSIKHDFWAVLTCAKNEVAGLRLALIEGRVNGSSYTGTCACLVGTIANVRHASFDCLGALKPDSNRPAERFFLGIKEGDTPEKNQCAKLALEWLDEWAALLGVDVNTSKTLP